jgi:hypothetical protein
MLLIGSRRRSKSGRIRAVSEVGLVDCLAESVMGLFKMEGFVGWARGGGPTATNLWFQRRISDCPPYSSSVRMRNSHPVVSVTSWLLSCLVRAGRGLESRVTPSSCHLARAGDFRLWRHCVVVPRFGFRRNDQAGDSADSHTSEPRIDPPAHAIRSAFDRSQHRIRRARIVVRGAPLVHEGCDFIAVIL